MYGSMRPGLTGLWQIDGRSSVDPHDRLDLDRQYVRGWNLWRDTTILLRTPLAVLHIRRAH
jgi:lipopolysaccharide/colanic/teichoic acid biosynthesis glycosyltransferase